LQLLAAGGRRPTLIASGSRICVTATALDGRSPYRARAGYLPPRQRRVVDILQTGCHTFVLAGVDAYRLLSKSIIRYILARSEKA
jgi:hypothetical protein